MGKTLRIALCIIIFTTMTGCIDASRYKSEDTDLYTVAMNSFVGSNSSHKDRILLLEEDNYGRKLFAYNSSDNLYFEYVTSIIIMQSSDDSKVYFYEDVNIIVRNGVTGFSFEDSPFTIEEKEALKEENDWNQELNIGKCISRDISDSKSKIQDLFDDFDIELFMKKKFEENEPDKQYFTFSLIGKKDDYLMIAARPSKEDIETELYFVFLSVNGEYDEDNYLDKVDDIYNYHNQLIEFKTEIKWYD